MSVTWYVVCRCIVSEIRSGLVVLVVLLRWYHAIVAPEAISHIDHEYEYESDFQVIAAIIVKNGEVDNNSLNDQCAWYGMTYIVDTTLGLILAIWGLKAIDWAANEWDWVSLKHSGVYEGVDGLLHWIHQVVAWLVILTVAKVIIYYFMMLTGDWLALFGNILFTPLQSNIRFELLFVMIFFPGVLNVIYFWIADHYLKAGAEHAGAHEEDTLDTELAKKKASLLPDGEVDDAQVPKIWVNEDGQGNAVV